MTTQQALTDQQIDEYEALIERTTPLGAATASPGMAAALLAEVRRQRALLAAVAAVHEKGEHNGFDICLHCASQMFPPPDTGIWSESAWPCETARALGITDAVVSAVVSAGAEDER